MALENLLSALIVAAITGLTFVAYKHPSGFKRITTIILVITGLGAFGALIWDISSSVTYSALRPFIDPEKLNDAEAVAKPLHILNEWAILIIVLVFLYLFFLEQLPSILGKKEQVKEKGKEENDSKVE